MELNQALSPSQSSAVLENASIGLRMVIEDGQHLNIDSHDLVPKIEGSMSMTLFNYQGETLAYLIVLTTEADCSGLTSLLLKALGKQGYQPYGEMSTHHGLNYYLTCLNTREDALKAALIQHIQAAYEAAAFFPPVAPAIDTVDFKAITLDGKTRGNEIFAAGDYTIINVWSTVCQLCLILLPDLIEWKKELPENIQVLHLTAEKQGIAHLDRTLLGQEIAQFGLDPDHVLLYETGFSSVIDTILSATPMTLVVDAAGNIVGDVILGPDIEPCKKLLNGLLER